MKSNKERQENRKAKSFSVKGIFLLCCIRANKVPLAAKPRRAILITI
ncbi:MAG: hypothetical protein J7K02_04000 [Deltaproteobacteria bacterium]|nr:hypothetical protein [Deltaproteobacteria bacterium]